MAGIKKILLITYKYVPEIAPRVFRWSSIIDEWAHKGIHADIVCAAYPGTTREENIDSSHIYRVMPWFKKKQLSIVPKESPANTIRPISVSSTKAKLQKSFFQKVKKYSRLLVTRGIAESGERVTIKLLLKKVVDKSKALKKRPAWKIKQKIRSFFWPDYGMLWIPPAYNMAKKLIRQNQYDAIITVSWPVSPHVVGSFIHKGIGKNIPWLVDIGDPFSFNKTTPINDFKKFAQKNKKFEQNLLRDASIVTVTTEETKADYIHFFSATESKIIVIPPLIPTKKNELRNSRESSSSKNQKIKLVFTGSLRSKNRRPDTLLRLFSLLISIQEFSDCIELHFYGDINQCLSSFAPYKDQINKEIFLHGIVKKELVDEVLSKADFLVNIGNVSENQLPSKIVEYLSANRPIINIASNPNDSSWKFLSSSGIALNLLASNPDMINSELVNQVVAFLENPPKSIPAERLNNLLAPYTADAVSQKYLQLICSLAN